MDAFISGVANTGFLGLFAIIVLGAGACYLLPNIVVILCAALLGCWVYGTTENLVVSIICFIIAGAYFVFFSYLRHMKLRAISYGYKTIREMLNAQKNTGEQSLDSAIYSGAIFNFPEHGFAAHYSSAPYTEEDKEDEVVDVSDIGKVSEEKYSQTIIMPWSFSEDSSESTGDLSEDESAEWFLREMIQHDMEKNDEHYGTQIVGGPSTIDLGNLEGYAQAYVVLISVNGLPAYYFSLHAINPSKQRYYNYNGMRSSFDGASDAVNSFNYL